MACKATISPMGFISHNRRAFRGINAFTCGSANKAFTAAVSFRSAYPIVEPGRKEPSWDCAGMRREKNGFCFLISSSFIELSESLEVCSISDFNPSSFVSVVTVSFSIVSLTKRVSLFRPKTSAERSNSLTFSLILLRFSKNSAFSYVS